MASFRLSALLLQLMDIFHTMVGPCSLKAVGQTLTEDSAEPGKLQDSE